MDTARAPGHPRGMRGSHRLGALLLAGAAACSAREAPEPIPSAPPPGAKLRWVRAFPQLIGTATAPPPYVDARQHWQTATVAFSRGDLEGSAQNFLDLAETLRRTTLAYPAHAGAFRAARCLAYENVGAIYRAAEAERGAALLRKARVEDPDCAETISRALTRFESAD
jgi:hypothetical protein